MRRGRRLSCVAIICAVVFLNAAAILRPAEAADSPRSEAAGDFSQFQKKVTEWTLPNGLKFIVFERHDVPIVSFETYANVGSVDEDAGASGLAHLFEHMAFKGTKTIGTKDYKAEAKVMAKMDGIFDEILTERRKGENADKARLQQLEKQLKQAGDEEKKYMVFDQFEEMLTRAGGRGLNASTGQDSTRFVVSLPSNKVQLWMSMESDRFMNPVLREFYKEKEVVMEERRMGENNPTERLYEEFIAVAYKAHPYGRMVIGYMSDIENLTVAKSQAFFKKFYTPQNLTIVMVGDVHPQQVKKLSQKYFGPIPGGSKTLPVNTVEPPQLGEHRVTIEDTAQPLLIIGYHRPNINHPDNAVFETIGNIMASGRTCRLYKSLVEEKKIAVSTDTYGGAAKYPGLFVFYIVPARGHTGDECEKAVYAEVDKLKTRPVSEQELQKAKTRSRADLINQLESNSGLASELAFYDVLTGSWKNLFGQLDKINNVSAQDIQRVAAQYFTTKNRTVGVIQTTAANPTADANTK